MTTQTGTGATNSAVICKPWRAIHYSRKDTDDTVTQVRVHNRTGERLRCPRWGDE